MTPMSPTTTLVITTTTPVSPTTTLVSSTTTSVSPITTTPTTCALLNGCSGHGQCLPGRVLAVVFIDCLSRGSLMFIYCDLLGKVDFSIEAWSTDCKFTVDLHACSLFHMIF